MNVFFRLDLVPVHLLNEFVPNRVAKRIQTRWIRRPTNFLEKGRKIVLAPFSTQTVCVYMVSHRIVETSNRRQTLLFHT
jgi:hypothetical protein